MAFGTTDRTDEVMNEINVVPLVDVMLVLLIIFIVTIPVINHAIKVELPEQSSAPLETPPETLRVAVTSDGQYSVNEQMFDEAALQAFLSEKSLLTPQPELHILGDKAVRYEKVTALMSMAKNAGLQKIGFVTEPATAP